MKKFFLLLELMRFDKPIGTLLLLWPTLSALYLISGGYPSLKIVIIFTVGTFLMRSAGCVINDFFDKEIDGSVARTKDRPLVTGSVSEKEAIYLFIFLLSLSGFLLFFLNKLSLYLALMGLGLTLLYPLTKRFFRIPQLFLGLAFSWGILLASASVLNHLPLLTWLMFLACFFWIIAYDTVYAMIDLEDDKKIGNNSSAITFGDKDTKIVFICYFLSILFWLLAGVVAKVTLVYYMSLILVTIICLNQRELIKERNPQKCFKAFQNNNWVGLSIFIGSFLGTI